MWRKSPEEIVGAIKTPRDRNSSFEPKIVREGQRLLPRVRRQHPRALYLRGLLVRDIEAHLPETYGVKIGHDLISGLPTRSWTTSAPVHLGAPTSTAWARVPVNFDSSWRRAIPDHWHTAGPRTSAAEVKKRARKATTPVHGVLNYTYAILETEATIAAHTLGFDPSLGPMHADQRYRSSLATDLMEPADPRSMSSSSTFSRAGHFAVAMSLRPGKASSA